MTRPLLAAAAGLALLYLLVCAVMFVFQRSLIYLPQPRHADRQVPTLTLETGGERLVITTHRVDRPDAVLYFGGNAEDVSSSLPRLARAFPDRALYLMHYRGFGGSSGRPAETALVDDALALHDRVAPGHRSILVVGRSLGSGVAIPLAARRPVAGLVLVTPFNSLLELASDLYPWLPVAWLLRDRYESWRHAPCITAPTRFIIAARDDVVPIASSDRLQRHFRPDLVTRVQIPDTDHITILDAASLGAALVAPDAAPAGDRPAERGGGDLGGSAACRPAAVASGR